MNSWALYYNKSMLKAAGISSPPTTLAQLYADQAKEWKISGSKLEQIGFYPSYNQGFEYFDSFFGAVNCFDSSGKYDLDQLPGRAGRGELPRLLRQLPVLARRGHGRPRTAAVAGGDDDPFVAGKEGFAMDGPWEGAQNIPVTNSAMVGNFGVVPFPDTVGGPSTFGQGNYNIIPKGAAHPQQAFEFIAWLAGYNNESFMTSDRPEGRLDARRRRRSRPQPAYQAWLKANPWLNVFIEQMSSPLSVTPKLTPTESEFLTAEATATENIAETARQPQQALTYIDQQANSGAGG